MLPALFRWLRVRRWLKANEHLIYAPVTEARKYYPATEVHRRLDDEPKSPWSRLHFRLWCQWRHRYRASPIRAAAWSRQACRHCRSALRDHALWVARRGES